MFNGYKDLMQVPHMRRVYWTDHENPSMSGFRNIQIGTLVIHKQCNAVVVPAKGTQIGSKVFHEGCRDDQYGVQCEKCGKRFCLDVG